MTNQSSTDKSKIPLRTIAQIVLVVIAFALIFIFGWRIKSLSFLGVEIEPPTTPTKTQSEATLAPIISVNEAELSNVIYDDFNDTAYDGKYNLEKWIIDRGNGKIFQQDGSLVAQVNSGEDGVSLTAIKYQNFKIETPMFFEAKLMLKEPITGHVFMYLGLNSSPGIFSDCTLGYGDVIALLDCGYVVNQVTEYRQDDKLVNFTTWHTVRIEVEPSTMTLTYYIDGQEIHSFIPKNSGQLKSERFNLQLGIVSNERNSLTGYIDDISIGEIR